MKGLMFIGAILILLSGLALANSELANPFQGIGNLIGVIVESSHQAKVNQAEDAAHESVIYEQSKADIDKIRTAHNQDMELHKALTQKQIDDINREAVRQGIADRQALEQAQALYLQELQNRQANSELLRTCIFILVVCSMVCLGIICLGYSIRLLRKNHNVSRDYHPIYNQEPRVTIAMLPANSYRAKSVDAGSLKEYYRQQRLEARQRELDSVQKP